MDLRESATQPGTGGLCFLFFSLPFPLLPFLLQDEEQFEHIYRLSGRVRRKEVGNEGNHNTMWIKVPAENGKVSGRALVKGMGPGPKGIKGLPGFQQPCPISGSQPVAELLSSSVHQVQPFMRPVLSKAVRQGKWNTPREGSNAGLWERVHQKDTCILPCFQLAGISGKQMTFFIFLYMLKIFFSFLKNSLLINWTNPRNS